MLLKRLWFCPPGDMWQCLDVLLVATTGEGGRGATGIWWVEARDAANHPAMPRTAPQNKNKSGPIPDGSLVKNTHAGAGDVSSIPGSRKIPWRRTGSPLQYSCLGNPMDRGDWRGYSPWGHKDSDTTERLSDSSTCQWCQGRETDLHESKKLLLTFLLPRNKLCCHLR